MKRVVVACYAIVGASILGSGAAVAEPVAEAVSEASRRRVEDLWGRVPLHFEANRGQTDDRVRFLARGPGYGIFLTDTDAVVRLPAAPSGRGRRSGDESDEVVRLRLLEANPRPEVVGAEEMTGKANYLIGDDPSGWNTAIPLFGRVEYRQVYPGVSLAYYGNRRQLEYDLTVEPGADLRRIRMRVEGARRLRIDGDGNLVIETPRGAIVQRAPVVYEEGAGGRRPLPARYVLRGRRDVGFAVEGRRPSARLVIDPVVLVYSTFLGGTLDDSANAIALDRNRNAYITGGASSSKLPAGTTPRAIGPIGGGDVFVVKLDEFGSLVYSTYIGGQSYDQGLGIAVDEGGNAFVTGLTSSGDFPKVPDVPAPGGGDAFVTELNAAGSALVYSTLLGGSDFDQGDAIALDASGRAYVTGYTYSIDFPTRNPLGPGALVPGGGALQGTTDAFVARILAGGTLDFSTYLGGGKDEEGTGIAVAGASAYVVGNTSSSAADFPVTPGVVQNVLRGQQDAFVARFNDDGTLAFATYHGGEGFEEAGSIAVDAVGDAYITGSTDSTLFPLVSPAQATPGGGKDAFVSKLKGDGTRLLYSTYLGGKQDDVGRGIAVDAAGAAHVTGETSSDDFPIFDDIVTASTPIRQDVFVTKVAAPGCAFVYSAVIGSSEYDAAGSVGGIAVSGPIGGVEDWIVGLTSAGDFPVVDPPQPGTIAQSIYGGGTADAFAARISSDGLADIDFKKTDSPDPVFVGGTLTYTIGAKNNGPQGAYGLVVQDTLPPFVTFGSANVLPPATGSCTESSGVVSCSVDCLAVGDAFAVQIVVTVDPGAPSTITNQARLTRAESAAVLTVSEDTTVTPVADLEVDKTGPPTATLGSSFPYVVTVTNHGPSDATGVVITDTLPPNVTFLSSSPVSCPPSAGVMTCAVGPLTAGSSVSLTINVQAAAVGTAVNRADVTGAENDPGPGTNTKSVTTVIGFPGHGVRFFTVTSTSNQNVLEWINPVTDFVSTVINAKAGSCPTAPTEIGATVIVPPAAGGVAGARMSFTHTSAAIVVPPLGAVNGTTICYAAWVNISVAPGTAGPRYVKGRPFDNSAAATDVRWAFSTGATSVVPPGIGPSLHMVSNDNSLYAAVKGIGGGTWPAGWTPLPMNGPSQGRPSTINLNVGGASRVIFLGSQDTNVRAINADSGFPEWAQSLGAGNEVEAGLSGWFSAFGATPGSNYMVVGTRNTSADNSFWALNATTGAPAWALPFSGEAGNRIGIINGQAVVDYAAKRVYFTSYARTAGDDTVWCLDITTGAKVWSKAQGDIAGAPSLRGGKLYVPTNDGRILALNTTDGSTAWTFTTGDGMARGFVFLDRFSNQVYFSTDSFVWSVTAGASTPTWKRPLLTPSTPLFSAALGRVYVGSGDGKLYSLDAATGAPVAAETNVLGDGLATVGSPSLDVLGGFLYAGTEAGVVYAVELP
jgi:uncharacterized repeat protein (TIGR01451 family)